jgi:hypothetical protein
MFSYLAYGLKIRATFPLPELPVGNGAPADVTISRGVIDRPRPQTSADGSHFSMSGGEAYLYWDEVGGFLVRNGREIIVDSSTMAADHIVRLPLLGTVLSAAVCQRGFAGFHGSAVEIDGEAVAFLGHRGSGKSTMAAALYARGHNLLTDDLVVISNLKGPGGPTIVPGFPQLKLFPEAARASLGDDPEALPRLIEGFEKRARRVTGGFADAPVPLRAIYLLQNDPQLAIEPIAPHQTLFEVLRHSYEARIFNKSLTGARAATHFQQCADLVSKVSVSLLKRPVALEQLPDVVDLLEAEIRAK